MFCYHGFDAADNWRRRVVQNDYTGFAK